MLLGETRAALVQTTEELVGMVKVNESKVLMVDCEVEDGCMKEVPQLWRRIQLTREAGDGLLRLVVAGKEFLEKGVRCAFLLQLAQSPRTTYINICVLLIRDIFFLYWNRHKPHIPYDFLAVTI